jgi:hypothetical protein
MLEVTARERTHARGYLVRVAADAQILVVPAPPSNLRVRCQPSAIDLGLLHCGPAFHFL